MFGLSLLSGAWWAAKALVVRDAASRLLNKQAGVALAIVVGFVVVVISGAWIVHEIKTGAVAGWQSKYLMSRYVSALKERKAQREADARAAAEREVLMDQIRTSSEYAAKLEGALAAQVDNPVCFPDAITKELRK
jgi:hypothetical protein